MKEKKLVFDSSIWIDALNGINSSKVLLLRNCIESEVSIVLFPIIAREILQGIRHDEQFEKVLRSLKGFDILSIDNWETEIGAAILFRNLRKGGITIRKPNDCIIAYLVMHFNLTLVHNDSDFDLIASGSELSVYS